MELLFTMLIPLILAGTALYAMARRVDVYDALLCGAKDGLSVLLRIVPALVALLPAVYMLRASGALELAAEALGPVLSALGIPAETVGLMLVRPVSGSAALGVGAELISSYGPDSLVGRTAAVMLGSTETTFYTIAVYGRTAVLPAVQGGRFFIHKRQIQCCLQLPKEVFLRHQILYRYHVQLQLHPAHRLLFLLFYHSR